MPSSWLQRSLARSVFLRVDFFQPFSLFFFSVSGSFPFSLFFFPRRFVFKQRLTASRLRWIRTVPLRLRVVNQPPRLHQFPHHRPPLLRYYRRPLRSPSQRRLCHIPLLLAAFRENGAPNSSSSTSGNSHAAPSAINVLSTHTSTSTGCRSSSLAGSVTVPSFLSTYSSILIRPSRIGRHHPCSILPWYPRAAARPWRLRSGKCL